MPVKGLCVHVTMSAVVFFIQTCNRTYQSTPSGSIKRIFRKSTRRTFQLVALLNRSYLCCSQVGMDRLLQCGRPDSFPWLLFVVSQQLGEEDDPISHLSLDLSSPTRDYISSTDTVVFCPHFLPSVRFLYPPAVVFRLRVRGPENYKYARFRKTRFPSLLHSMSFSNGSSRSWATQVNMPLYQAQHVHALWEARSITV